MWFAAPFLHSLSTASGADLRVCDPGATTSAYSYDAAGNLTPDGTHSYQWDAENHLKALDNGTNDTFTYNAYGWRVYNTSGSVSYLLDPSGQFFGGV